MGSPDLAAAIEAIMAKHAVTREQVRAAAPVSGTMIKALVEILDLVQEPPKSDAWPPSDARFVRVPCGRCGDPILPLHEDDNGLYVCENVAACDARRREQERVCSA